MTIATYDVGLNIGVEGDAAFQKKIALINQNAKELNSEMKAVTSGFNDNDSAQKKLTATTGVLTKQMETQRAKIDLLNGKLKEQEKQLEEIAKEYEKTVEEQGKDSVAAQKLANDYARQATEVSKTKTQINQATAEYNKMNTEMSKQSEQLDKATSKSEKFKEAMSKVAEVADKVAKKTKAVSAAAAGLVTGMIGLAVKTGKTADEYFTLAQQSGFTVEELQRFSYAADMIDVDMNDIVAAASKMKKSMESNEDTFNRLGISIRNNATGELRDSTDVFFDTIRVLSAIENETLRDTIAMDLFGRGADSLAGIIDDGGAALNYFGDQAEEAGLILSGEALQSASDFNDKIDELKAKATQAFLSAGNTLADTLQPALEKLAGVLEKVLGWIASIDSDTLTMIITVAAVVAAISPLASIISGIATAMGVLNTVMTVASGPIGIVIAAIGALIAIGALVVANWDTIKAKAEEVGNWIVEKWTALKEKVSAIWEGVKTVTSTYWNSIKGAVQENASAMRTAFEENGGGIQGAAAAIWAGIQNAWTQGFNAMDKLTGGKLSEIVESFKNKFNELVQGALNWGRDIIQNLVNGIKEKISAVTGAVSDIAQKIKDFLHFSEPDEGPLSDFNSWMPDMMSQMAAQIERGRGLVQRAAEDVAGDLAGALNVNSTITAAGMGSVVFNITQQPGEDSMALAQRINRQLGRIYA